MCSEELEAAIKTKNVWLAEALFRNCLKDRAFEYIKRATQLPNGTILQKSVERFCESTMQEGRNLLRPNYVRIDIYPWPIASDKPITLRQILPSSCLETLVGDQAEWSDLLGHVMRSIEHLDVWTARLAWDYVHVGGKATSSELEALFDCAAKCKSLIIEINTGIQRLDSSRSKHSHRSRMWMS
jgi:hypothetical protein